MTDRGYERRAEMVGWLAAAVGFALFVTVVVVIAHFVAKFW